MANVLQTRMVGYAPDASGDPIAPNEIVYMCQEPVRARPSWALKIWTLLTLAGAAWMLWRAAASLFTG